jgi:uncharacterized membrane protein YphA (DoxX/SURF4 family)
MGAVIFVNMPGGFLSVANAELWVSVLVLAGLVAFMIFGAGRYSLDDMRRKEMEAAHH